MSVYGLTIEKNTPLAGMLDKGKVELPDEDCQLAMYELVQEYLEAQGLHRYERFQIMQCQVRSQGITLFTGIICRICLLAVPPAALMAVNVFTATDSVTDYIESIQSGKSCGGFEDLTKEMQLSEYLFMGLRTTVGIDLIETEQRFGCDVMLEFGVELEKFIRGNLVFCDIEHRRMRLTEQGMRFSNEIFEIFVK